MATYRHKQETVDGIEKYRRCRRIELGNPKNGEPHAIFSAEDAVVIGDETVIKGGDDMRIGFHGNEDKTFPLIDRETGEEVGTASYADVYQMMMSAYLHAEQERENRLQAEAEEEQRRWDEMVEKDAEDAE